jgi:hypothetical protein
MTLGAATRDDAGRRAIQCPVSWLTTTEATRPVEAEVCDMIVAEAVEAQNQSSGPELFQVVREGGLRPARPLPLADNLVPAICVHSRACRLGINSR